MFYVFIYFSLKFYFLLVILSDISYIYIFNETYNSYFKKVNLLTYF